MGFDLTSLLRARRNDGAELWDNYLNPQTAKVLRSIGFDRRWERAGGCYLYDDTGAKYLDYLSGFGVFGLGRDHPVVRARPSTMCSTPSWPTWCRWTPRCSPACWRRR